MIQYVMHQYIMISIIQYEITCTYIYLYQMYDTIYETKEIKIEINQPMLSIIILMYTIIIIQ